MNMVMKSSAIDLLHFLAEEIDNIEELKGEMNLHEITYLAPKMATEAVEQEWNAVIHDFEDNKSSARKNCQEERSEKFGTWSKIFERDKSSYDCKEDVNS
jgi:hypothetical protein